MTLPFYFLLNIILISRLIFTFFDEALDRKRIAIMTSMQVVGLLLYEINITWALLVVVLIIINIMFYKLEQHSGKINKSRLLSLLTYVIVLSIFFSPKLELHFNSEAFRLLGSLQNYSLLFAGVEDIDWLRVNIIALGLLLVTNEANIFIRFLIQNWRLSTSVKRKRDKADPTDIGIKEYNTGRVIGILERLLIFYFVLISQYAAIGLILTAKGISLRSRELEKPAFAEYVLVGTLISTLVAMLIAGIILLLLA